MPAGGFDGMDVVRKAKRHDSCLTEELFVEDDGGTKMSAVSDRESPSNTISSKKVPRRRRLSSKNLIGQQREQYLAKNKAAASKSREKRKIMEHKLEDKLRLLQAENTVLKHSIDKLRDEIVAIKYMCLQHVNCDCSRIREHMYQLLDNRLKRDSVSEISGSPTYSSSMDPQVVERVFTPCGSA